MCVCVCVCVCRRSQHCEVEKRRRERMNRYMNELAQMIPTCAAVPRRLDKLSILKMAVDHMKTLRGQLSHTHTLSLSNISWLYRRPTQLLPSQTWFPYR